MQAKADRFRLATPRRLKRLGQELSQIMASLHEVARKMGLSYDSVRGHAYPDGKVIARILAPVGRSTVRNVVASMGDAWTPYPRGTWFEGSLLFHMKDDWKNYASRYSTMAQVQSFGSQSFPRLQSTLIDVMWPKLKGFGYPKPQSIVVRVARTIDDSNPYRKKDPPSRKRFNT
jgi:hypothetical protein